MQIIARAIYLSNWWLSSQKKCFAWNLLNYNLIRMHNYNRTHIKDRWFSSSDSIYINKKQAKRSLIGSCRETIISLRVSFWPLFCARSHTHCRATGFLLRSLNRVFFLTDRAWRAIFHRGAINVCQAHYRGCTDRYALRERRYQKKKRTPRYKVSFVASDF